MILLLATLQSDVTDITLETELIREKNYIFVRYFSPNCHHCIAMQGAYKQLAASFGEDPDDIDAIAVTIAQIDCQRNNAFCQQQNIQGYPTLLLYKQGRIVAEYEGDRSYEDMDMWIRRNVGMPIKQKNEKDPIDASNTFHTLIQSGYTLCRFFAPWCSHCVQMKSAYRQLAAELDGIAKVAEVDCTKTALCNQLGIRAYPTLFLYKNGQQLAEYEGQRVTGPMKEFVLGLIEEQATMDAVEVPSIKPDELQKPGFQFVKFFSPQCSHCIEMQPEYKKLAASFNGSSSTRIVEINCEQYKAACQKFGIRGYPTLLLLKDGEQVAEFEGHRSATAMRSFIEGRIRELELAADSSVIELTNSNFYDYVKTSSLFVAFCVPGHQTCQFLRPAFQKLAGLMKDTELVIGWVDCSKQGRICSDQMISGYPKVFLYENGAQKDSYGARIDENDMRMWLLMNADAAL